MFESDDEESQIRRVREALKVSVEEVLLCHTIGRAIVLVPQHRLSAAIGPKGQNVRLASQHSGWDLVITTSDELESRIENALFAFRRLPRVTDELAQQLVEEGYLSWDDLSVIAPEVLMAMGGLNRKEAETIVDEAEKQAEIHDDDGPS